MKNLLCGLVKLLIDTCHVPFLLFPTNSKESVDMTIKELEENLQVGLTNTMTSSTKKLAYAKVVGTSCDVCDPNDVRKLANFAVKELGSVDIWVSS